MTDQPDLDRRNVLHALGAASGLSLLNGAVAADKVPGTQVEDRSSSIRLTGLKAYWVGPIVYVKLEAILEEHVGLLVAHADERGVVGHVDRRHHACG